MKLFAVFYRIKLEATFQLANMSLYVSGPKPPKERATLELKTCDHLFFVHDQGKARYPNVILEALLEDGQGLHTTCQAVESGKVWYALLCHEPVKASVQQRLHVDLQQLLLHHLDQMPSGT